MWCVEWEDLCVMEGWFCMGVGHKVYLCMYDFGIVV